MVEPALAVSIRGAATIQDYELVKKCGVGAYGKVYLARHKESSEHVAIKQLDKQALVKLNKQDAVMREKALLKQLQGAPFIIELLSTFMDAQSLYFVFEHCKYGTLSNLITQEGKCREEQL